MREIQPHPFAFSRRTGDHLNTFSDQNRPRSQHRVVAYSLACGNTRPGRHPTPSAPGFSLACADTGTPGVER